MASLRISLLPDPSDLPDECQPAISIRSPGRRSENSTGTSPASRSRPTKPLRECANGSVGGFLRHGVVTGPGSATPISASADQATWRQLNTISTIHVMRSDEFNRVRPRPRCAQVWAWILPSQESSSADQAARRRTYAMVVLTTRRSPASTDVRHRRSILVVPGARDTCVNGAGDAIELGRLRIDDYPRVANAVPSTVSAVERTNEVSRSHRSTQ